MAWAINVMDSGRHVLDLVGQRGGDGEATHSAHNLSKAKTTLAAGWQPSNIHSRAPPSFFPLVGAPALYAIQMIHYRQCKQMYHVTASLL